MKQSNEQLVEDFQSGNSQAFDLLLKKNQGLIYKVVRKFAKDEDTIEELGQRCSIAMFKAAEKFEFSRGLKFSTAATTYILNECRRFAQEKTFKKNTPTISLHDTMGGERELIRILDDGSETPFETVEKKLDFEVDMQKARKRLSRLSNRDRDIILRRMQGETLEAIGEAHGVSKERVRQIETKCLAFLRNPPRFKWTKKKDGIIRQEYGYGNAQKIADKIGTSVHSVRARASRIGCAKPQLKGSHIAEIIDMWKSGQTTTQISQKVGFTAETIRETLKRKGVYDNDFTSNTSWRQSQKRKESCVNASRIKKSRNKKRSMELVGQDWPLAAALVLYVLINSPGDRDQIVDRCQKESKVRGWHCVVNSWRTALKYTRWLRDKGFVVADGGGNTRRIYSVKDHFFRCAS